VDSVTYPPQGLSLFYIASYFIVLLIFLADFECAHYLYPDKCSMLVILGFNIYVVGSISFRPDQL